MAKNWWEDDPIDGAEIADDWWSSDPVEGSGDTSLADDITMPEPAAAPAQPEEPGFLSQVADTALKLASPIANFVRGQGPKPAAAPPAPARAPASQAEPKPYRDRREALDDAVNLIEEGVSQQKVVEAFSGLGITLDEIASHGQKRGSDYFKQQPQVPVDPEVERLRKRAPAPEPTGEIKASDYVPRSGGLQRVEDIGREFAGGALTGVKGLTDSAGANNEFSQAIAAAREIVLKGRSNEAKATDLIASQIMEEAENKGLWEQVKAGAEAFMLDPTKNIAQGAGTIIPTVAGGKLLAANKTVQGLGAAGAQILGKAGSATAGMTAGSAITGGVMAAGMAKDQIFETVKSDAIASGMTEEEADKIAMRAQEYASNPDVIMAAGALGLASGGIGVQPAIFRLIGQNAAKELAKEGVIRSTIKGVLAEAPLEALQGGSEALAGNIASLRSGFDVDPLRGVGVQATMEALSAAPLGGAVGLIEGATAPRSAERMIADEINRNVEATQWATPAEEVARSRLSPSTVSFTPPDSPTAQAGLVPISVPVVTGAADVSTGPLAGPATAAGGELSGSLGGASLGAATTGGVGAGGISGGSAGGLASVGGTTAPVGNADGQQAAGLTPRSNPAQRASDTDLLGRVQQQMPEQRTPVTTWTGRAGDGYATQEAAQAGLETRVKREPDLDWEIQQMPSGKFQLVGYARTNEQVPAETNTTASTGGGLSTAGATGQSVEAAGVTGPTPTEVRTTNQDGTVSVATWTQMPDGRMTRQVRTESATAPGITGVQYIQNPELAQTASTITFGPGQLGAVKVSQRKALTQNFTQQEMDDGTTVFTRITGPATATAGAGVAGQAGPVDGGMQAGQVGAAAVGATQGVGPASALSGGAAQDGSPDPATIASDLSAIRASWARTTENLAQSDPQWSKEDVELELADPMRSANAQFAQAVARIVKAPIAFVRGKNGVASWQGMEMGGRLYLNTDSREAPVLAVTMHEVGHSLPEDIKRNMIAGVMATVTPQQRQRFLDEFSAYRDNTPEAQDEELVMRIIEQDAQNPEFWQKLGEKMGDTEFARLAREVLKVLDRLMAGFRRENSSEFTSDIERVRDIVSSAYAEAEQRVNAGRGRPGVAQPRASTARPATKADLAKAAEYERRTGLLPYTSEGQIEVPLGKVVTPRASVKRDGKYGNHPIFDIPVNANGTVTLYYPATNAEARRVAKEKSLRAADGKTRIYLTNESGAAKVMAERGNIDQEMEGANVLVQVDPNLLQLDREYDNGRKDFFIPLAEGQAFFKKMRMTRLFTQNAPRTKAISKDTKLTDLERRIDAGVKEFLGLDAAGKRARLKQARDTLKAEHNVTTLMGVNGKLEKTNTGGYGLNNYNGKDVKSMGLGLASAQKINEQNLSTCPKSAICEGLCLGETSGQNLLYGGEGDFKSGPRMSQYLKTEAMVLHPEDFAIVLYSEIAKLQKDAKKEDYQASVRLNVTSDFRPQTFKGIIEAFPEVMFYDYTKLPTKSIAPNHHLTYSSTGASQVVNGKTIVNPESNWNKMTEVLRRGDNVAMAFSDKNTMPKYVIDGRTGERFQVWDGDNYDARFLDPKPGQEGNEFGKGMIIGLTNKDRTGKPEMAAEKNRGFFIDYNPERDGDTVTIRDQDSLAAGRKVIPLAMASAPRRPDVGSLEAVRQQWDAAGVDGSIFESNGVITLSKIVVPKAGRNDGVGTAAMQALVDYADQTGQRIALTPSSDFGGSKARLEQFYKRFGFKSNKGRNKDFTISESMVREPAQLGNQQIVPQASAPRNPQTQTAAFKKWFGDSKVVDANGEPLVVYHGTQADVSEFKTGEDGLIHVGTVEQANARLGRRRSGANVMPVYVAASNLKRVRDHGTDNDAWKKEAATAKAEGYDGLVYTNRYEAAALEQDSYAVFRPEQIKSATGNAGTFDATNPDIRASAPRDPNLAGRKVTYEVLIEDTGETATLTVDAKQASEDYNSRVETMRKLLRCLGK